MYAMLKKFYLIIFRFDKIMLYYAWSPRKFSHFTTHWPKIQTFTSWQQTNTQITGVLHLQKQV